MTAASTTPDGTESASETLTPSEVRRARRRVPLAERAAVRALQLDEDGPTGHATIGRGLAAFFTVQAAPAKPAPEAEPPRPVQVSTPPKPAPAAEPLPDVQVPPAVLAATLSAPRRVETEWLAAPELDGALHHGDLPLHAVHDLAVDEQYRVGPAFAILLSCGRITRAISFPGAWQRTDAARCPACCEALGYPPGTGSPVNDDACRPVLAVRFGATP